MDYSTFLKSKAHPDELFGFKPVWMPDFLFDFQRSLVDWSIRKGRSALFEDCGLGKTIQELVWAENLVRKTGRPVLILTPLAVSPQTVREGEKFGIKATQTREGKVHKGINVTNYERLHYFNPKDFVGIVCDESSILKSFSGKIRRGITNAMKQVEFRLLCSATPAPNDYAELGNSSEALGGMGRNNMLREFFINADDPVGNIESTHHWRLKGHGGKAFWTWVASWARAVRRPSDMGFPDDKFILPKLNVEMHVVEGQRKKGPGFFPEIAKTLHDQRKERWATLEARCSKVAELLPKKEPCLIWCHLNAESKLLTKMIPDAVEICGSDSDEVKEKRMIGFTDGKIRVIVTKPKIAGFGLNWQHCRTVSYFPSHSHEQYYQAIRRCWRFGQKKEVNCHIVTSQAEQRVVKNMIRKEQQSEELYSGIVKQMMTVLKPSHRNGETSIAAKVPSWL